MVSRERVNTAFEFKQLEQLLFELSENHDFTPLNAIKNLLNDFFIKSQCKQVIYTTNVDMPFFGIKVYPTLNGTQAIDILADVDSEVFPGYYIEFDSKLFDIMMDVTGDELCAMVIYAIYHTIYDAYVIDEVRFRIDQFFAATNSSVNLDSSKGYRELLAYGIKDAMCKSGSPFTKGCPDEVSIDGFLADFNYSASMMNGLKKVCLNINFMHKDIDERLITLSWVLRVCNDYEHMRIPAYKTLHKAVDLTGSALEKREIMNAMSILNSTSSMSESNIEEGFLSNWKRKSIRGIQADVYELQLRIRTAEEPEDLMSILRAANSKIAILRDYMEHEKISNSERAELEETLQLLYSIRQQVASEKEVKSRYSGYIQVTYPGI